MESETQKLENLIELADLLSQQNDFQEILRVVAQKAVSLLNAEAATIMMINPQTRQTVKTIFKEEGEGLDRRHHAVHTHVGGWVIKKQQAFASANLKADSRFAKSLFENLPKQAVLAAPLRSEGIVMGALVLLHPEVEEASLEPQLVYLQKLASIVSPFLRNVQKLQQYFDAPLPENALLVKYETVGLLGKSRKFIELLKALESAVRCDVRVLLEGESGSGKELMARAIHQFSNRRGQPFVAIDCGAIPANLIESELFGHVKGAFTGATTERKGLLEEAEGGTLFMDEISNLPLDMQAKLMRVLQAGEVRPLGSNKIRQVNVRIISASSIALRKLVASEKFREDLFYRLHVYPVQVPSLDDRRDDIALLANHFLKKFAAQQCKPAASFHEEILDFMQQRHWAGNIRELENFVERLVTLAPPELKVLDHDFLPDDVRKEMKKLAAHPQDTDAVKPLNESLAEYEGLIIRNALVAGNWNIAKTARALRIAEQTLRYKMGKLGIVRGQRA